MIKYTTMKRMGLFKTVSLLLGCLTMFSCVDYDDIQPFTGKTLPRKSGYSTGVTNDWIYFNLRTGESFNTYTVNKDIKEGEQINRTDWDLAFCGYTMRTNSGTSGIGHRQIGELSGGQKKRVFLARAIAQQGQVILLDEPFTGVDVQTEARIISLLRELRDEGCTMLVSTHNLGSVSEFCDYTVMVKGTVLASGPTETTFTAENLERAFSGVLRHVALTGGEAQVITDDERPFISRRAAGGPR